MESIAVTKPNMTVTRQEALSPFGLLTALFTEEITRRNSRSTGFYRAMPLAYLDESEREALPSPPEVRIELNVDLLLNRLLKDAREREKNEKKPQTPPERILERIVVRERELRTAYSETRRVVIETGGKRYTANVPARALKQIPDSAKISGAGGTMRADREVPGPGENSRPAAVDAQKRTGSPSKRLSAVGTAKPAHAWITADRTLPLASRMLSAPAAGGWTPQHRELHPGYPVRSEKKQTEDFAAGSILLPDVLRHRREEAIAQSETRAAAVDVPEDYGVFGDVLEWSTDGIEKTSETERVLREVRRAVDETLRRNTSRADETPAQSEKRGEHRESPIRSYTAGSQQESSDSRTRARAHAHEAPETKTENKAGSVLSAHGQRNAASAFAPETEPTAGQKIAAAAVQGADGNHISTDRGTAATSEQVFQQPAFPTGTAVRKEAALITAVPIGEETDVSSELTYREHANAPELQTASGTETAIPSETPETDHPAELTYREETEERARQRAEKQNTEAPALHPPVRAEAETAGHTKPVTAIPSATPETNLSAELTYREETEESPRQRAERRNTEAPTPHPPVRTEAEAAGHINPVTALPSEAPEKDHPAELTYREETEERVRQRAEKQDTEAPAPHPPVRTETETAEHVRSVTAIPLATSEEDLPAELTLREETEESPRQRAERRNAEAPAPHPPVRTETETAGHTRPETAIPAAITSAYVETAASAELTYREDTEKNAVQSASQRTDGTMRNTVSAQLIFTPLPRHEESHREQQTEEASRAQKAAGQTVRDLSMTSEQGRRRSVAARSGRRSAEQTDPDAQEMQDTDRIALPVGEEADPSGPAELFFAAPSSSEPPPEDPTAARPAKPSESDKTNELPTWAKELLEKSGVSQAEQRSAALNWDSGSPGARQVNWTVPAAIPQQRVPDGRTELSFKEPREAEQLPARQLISDAEIQRTADRVYKIIEERLRRELRRSGR